MHYLVETAPVSDDGSQLVHGILSRPQGLAELRANTFMSLLTLTAVATVLEQALGLSHVVGVVQPVSGGPVVLRLRLGDVAICPRTLSVGNRCSAICGWDAWRLQTSRLSNFAFNVQ